MGRGRSPGGLVRPGEGRCGWPRSHRGGWSTIGGWSRRRWLRRRTRSARGARSGVCRGASTCRRRCNVLRRRTRSGGQGIRVRRRRGRRRWASCGGSTHAVKDGEDVSGSTREDVDSAGRFDDALKGALLGRLSAGIGLDLDFETLSGGGDEAGPVGLAGETETDQSSVLISNSSDIGSPDSEPAIPGERPKNVSCVLGLTPHASARSFFFATA